MLRSIVFILAAFMGFLLRQVGIPIPYMLGGIFTVFCCKTFYEPHFTGSLRLRNAMLGIAGYGIGSHCTADTIFRMGIEFPGVLGASLSTLFVSLCVAFYMARHTFANFLSCVMGCLPGGLTQMTLLMEDYRDADENVVVVAQCLRLFVVEVSVPFLAVNLFGGIMKKTVAPDLVTGLVTDGMTLFETGWLIVLPLAVLGQLFARKIHLPTGNLLGPILLTSLCAALRGNLTPVPPPVMAFAQISIGLYIGTLLDREKLLRTKCLVPNIFIGSLLMVGMSSLVAVIISRCYGYSAIGSFLAVAPGGIAEMCLAGMEMGQDVAMILTYQLIRVLMLNFAVPFAIKRYFSTKNL